MWEGGGVEGEGGRRGSVCGREEGLRVREGGGIEVLITFRQKFHHA